jgi:aminoglycoside phosphotransferase (APT) family kinase protein
MVANPTDDGARTVRPGEELDVAAVDAWLKTVEPGLDGLPEVTQYSGGASNWTYRLRYANRDLVLRRPPAGTKARSAHDMAREHDVQKALAPHFPLVARMVGLCRDPSVLGCEFYVMERLDGFIARRNLPRGMVLDAAATRRLCHSFVDALVDLHRVDYRAAGLATLFKGPGYARRQVEGWSGRYEKARTWNVPSFARVRAWLADHVPDDAAACVIHNDWRFDNMVLDRADPTRVVGVLDWEMATVGDPWMELGSALAYWVEPDDHALMRMTRRQPTHLPGMLRRAEVVEYYASRTGRSPSSWPFYEVFGLFRLAGIAQQIYYRYFHGETDNPAFKRFWIMVNYFDWRCRGIIRRSERAR